MFVVRELKLTGFVLIASLEVKSKAPNGVTFNVKGKSAHEGPIAGSVSLLWICRRRGEFVTGLVSDC